MAGTGAGAFDASGPPVYAALRMGTKPRKGKNAPVRSRRPVLGNDPFERGAAERLASAPPPPEATAPEPAAPAPAAAPRPAAARVAARLDELESRIDRGMDSAEARLAELARRTGPATYAEELRELLVRLLPALRDRLRPLASLAKVFAAPRGLDRYGMDVRLVDGARPLLDFLLESWWRVDLRGRDLLPDGPGVVVANHGGALPWDALVLRASAQRPPIGRDLRPLLDASALSLPVVGTLAARLGAVTSSPANAHALLSAGALVGVFPEGGAGGAKPWGDRYRLQRFGRGGFARVAARAGVPIVPCAIVGSEEASAPFDRPGWLAEALGLPLLAMTPALPFPPLAWLPLPSRWSIRFGRPVPPPPRGSADDPEAAAAVADQVRHALQRMLDEDVAARRSVFL